MSKKAKVVTHICIKGGVGKTTMSVLLAMYLSKIGKKVLAIGFDKQGNLENSLIEIDKSKPELIDVFNEDFTLSEAIQHGSICDIVPAGKNMKAIEIVLANVPGKDMLMQEYIQDVIEDYDYIICDVPPVEGTALNNALSITNYILIPSEIGKYSLDGLFDMAPIFKSAKRINKDIKVQGIFLNRIKENTLLQEDVTASLRDIATQLGTKFYETKIIDSVRVQEAQYELKNVFDNAKLDKVFMNYEKLASEIICDIEMGV